MDSIKEAKSGVVQYDSPFSLRTGER